MTKFCINVGEIGVEQQHIFALAQSANKHVGEIDTWQDRED